MGRQGNDPQATLRRLAREEAGGTPAQVATLRPVEVVALAHELSVYMISILDALDAALDRGMPAYVHCLAGRGRTGTVVGCYLVRHAERLLGTVDSDDVGPLALARITELRVAQNMPYAEESPPTQASRDLVLNWRAGL